MSYQTTIEGTAGLVGYWRLNETSGTSAADSSGNADNGTYTACTLNKPAVNATIGDPTVETSGASASIIIPDATQLQMTVPLTVEAWFKAPALPASGNRAFINKGSPGWGAGIDSGGHMFFVNYGVAAYFTTGVYVAAGNWYYAVWEFYHTGSNYNTDFYLNGVFKETVTGTSAPASNTGTSLQFGHSGDGDYDVLLSQVALYNVALSSATISSHYSAGTSGGAPTVLPPRTPTNWAAVQRSLR